MQPNLKYIENKSMFGKKKTKPEPDPLQQVIYWTDDTEDWKIIYYHKN